MSFSLYISALAVSDTMVVVTGSLFLFISSTDIVHFYNMPSTRSITCPKGVPQSCKGLPYSWGTPTRDIGPEMGTISPKRAWDQRIGKELGT